MSKNNFRHSKKIIGYFLSLLMVFSLLPVNPVFAQDVEYTYEALASSKVVGAWADSEETSNDGGDGNASKAFDGNYSTQWHTNWSSPGEGDKTMPHWITYQLSEPTLIGKIDYVGKPGANGVGNGVFKSVSVYTSTDANAPNGNVSDSRWVHAGDYNGLTYNPSTGTETNRTATFSFTPREALKVMIVVRESYSVPDDKDGENVFANAREIITYKATVVEPEPEVVEPTAKMVANGTSYDLPKDVTTGGNTVPEIEVTEGEEVKFVVSGKNLTKFSYMDPQGKTQRPSFTPGDTFECVLNDVQSGYYTFYITYEDSAGEEYTTSFDAKVLVQEESGPVTPDGFQGLIEIADNGIRQDGTTLYVTLEHQIDRLNTAIDGTSWTYDGDKTITFTGIPESGAFFGNFSVFDQDGRVTQHNIFREADGTWRVVVEYRSGVTYKDAVPSFYYGDGTADKQLVLDGSEEYTIYTTSGKPTIKTVGKHLESLQYYTIDVSGPTMTVYPEDDTDHTTLSATLNFEGSYRVIINDKVRTGSNKAISFKLNVVKGEEPEVVNKTELQALYDEVKKYVSDDTSYSKFETARDNAKAVLDKVDATQEEVDNAYNTLNQRYWLSKVDGMVKKYRPIESSSGNFDYELYVAESTLPIIRVYVEARNHTNTSYPAEELEKLYDQFVEAEKELESAGEKPRSVMVGPDVDQINTTSDRGKFAISEYQEDGKLYLHIEYTNDGINLIKGTDLGTISNYDLKNNARVSLIGYAYEEDGSLGGYSNTPITSKMEPLEGKSDFAAGFQVNVEVQPGKYGVKLTLTGGKKEQANSYGYYYTSELEAEVDKTELEKAINSANNAVSAANNQVVVTDGLEELEEVLSKAETLYADELATQEKVDAMVEELKAAVSYMKDHEIQIEILRIVSSNEDSTTLEVNSDPYGEYAFVYNDEHSGISPTISWTEKDVADGKAHITAKNLESGDNYFYVHFVNLWTTAQNRYWVYVNTTTGESDFGNVKDIVKPSVVLHVGEEDIEISDEGTAQTIEVPYGTETLTATISGKDIGNAVMAYESESAQAKVDPSADHKTVELNVQNTAGELVDGTYTVTVATGYAGKNTSGGASYNTKFSYEFTVEFATSLADKTKLQALYDEVEDHVSDDGYYDEFEEALANASDVLAKEDATQEEVDNAYENLELYYYRSLAYALAIDYKPVGASSGQWDGTFDYAKYEAEGALKVINAYYGVMNLGAYPEVSAVKDAYDKLVAAIPELKEVGEEPRSILVGPNDDLINVTESRGYFIFTETPAEDGKVNLHIEYVNDGISPINGKDFGEFLGRKFTAARSTLRLEYVTYDGVSGNINFKDDITLLGGNAATYVDGYEVDVTVEPGRYNVYMELEGVEVYSQGYYFTAKAVDKAELQKAIDEAEKLEEIYYTEDSWNNLQTVLASAKEVNEDVSADQNSVDQATDNLKQAIKDLEYEGYAKITEFIENDDNTVTIVLDRKIDSSRMSGSEPGSTWVYDGEYRLTSNEIPEDGDFFIDVVVEDLDGEGTHHNIYRDENGEWRTVVEYRYNGEYKSVRPQLFVQVGTELVEITPLTDYSFSPYVVEETLTGPAKFVVTGYDLKDVEFYRSPSSDMKQVIEPDGDHTRVEGYLMHNGVAMSGTYCFTLGSWTNGAINMPQIKVTYKLVDRAALENKITEASRIQGEGYIEESYAALQDEIAKAIVVRDDNTATQQEVDDAVVALQNAIENLQKLVDKTKLQALYDEAVEFNREDVKGYKELQERLESSKAVLDSDDKTQEQVDKEVIQLDGRYSYVLMQELSHDSQDKVFSTDYTTDSLKALVEVDQAVSTKTAFSKYSVIKQEDVDTVKAWIAKYEEALKGLVEADETTTQVGAYDSGLAVSSKNGEPQGEFTVLTKKAVVENGVEMYELKIQFNNTGNHPLYGESFTKYDGTEVTFGKFGGTNNAKLYVDTYNEDMSSIGREVVGYKEFVAFEGNTSRTPGFTATIRVPANAKYVTIDYVYNSDHTYSAGYWVVERLEDEPLLNVTITGTKNKVESSLAVAADNLEEAVTIATNEGVITNSNFVTGLVFESGVVTDDDLWYIKEEFGKNKNTVVNGLQNLVIDLGEDLVYLDDGETSTIFPSETLKGFSALKTVSLKGWTVLGDQSLYGTSSLETINIPDVTTLEYNALAHSGITSVDLPKVTTIGKKAFSTSDKLESINMPMVEVIEKEAFYGCESLTTITIPSTIKTLNGTSFGYYTDEVVNIVFEGDTIPEMSGTIIKPYKENSVIIVTIPKAGYESYLGTDKVILTEADLPSWLNGAELKVDGSPKLTFKVEGEEDHFTYQTNDFLTAEQMYEPTSVPEGQRFDAWYTQDDVKVVAGAKIEEDTVVYARFVQATDKSALQEAITKAEGLDEDTYLGRTWEVLEDALTSAKTVYDDSSATQEEVDNATKALNEAMDQLIEIVEGTSIVTKVEQDGTTVTLTLDRKIDKSNMSGMGAGNWKYDGEYSLVCTEVPETGEFEQDVVTTDLDGASSHHAIYRDEEGNWKIIANYRFNDGTIAKPVQTLTVGEDVYVADGTGTSPTFQIAEVEGTPVVVITGTLLEQVTVELRGSGHGVKEISKDEIPGDRSRIEVPLVSPRTGETLVGEYYVKAKSEARQAATGAYYNIKKVVEPDTQAPELVSYEIIGKDHNAILIKASEPLSAVNSTDYNKLEWTMYNDDPTEWVARYVSGGKNYKVELVDLAGNVSGEYTLDRINPEVEVTYSETNPTNKDVTVTLSFSEAITGLDDTWTKVDDTTYTKVFTANATETISYQDMVGNVGKDAVIEVANIDKDAPEVISVKVRDDGYHYILEANEPIIIEADNWHVMKDTNSTKWNGNYRQNGISTIVIKDLAGNETEVIIDHKKPEVVSLWVKEDGKHYVLVADEPITIDSDNWYQDDEGNGTRWVGKYSTDGIGTIVIKDETGNKTTVLVDHEKPTATYTLSETEPTNNPVTVTIKASEPVSGLTGWTRVDDVTYTKTFEENATEVVEFKDAVGNKGSLEVVVDNIYKDVEAPVIKVDSCDCPNADKGIHNHSIGYSVTDDSRVTVTVNGSPITLQDGRDWISCSEGQVFKKEIVATDEYGNSTSMTLYFDAKTPEIKLDSCDCPYAEEGLHNHSIGYAVEDDSDVTVIVNGSPITLQDGRDWISCSEGQSFIKEIVVTDAAGNKTELTLNFDAKAPTITLDPAELKVKVNGEVDLDDVVVTVEDNYGEATWSRSMDDVDTSVSRVVEVVYTAKDKAGNTATATLIVRVVTGISNTLQYDANGGVGGPVNNFTNGTTITVKSGQPTRNGYNFTGWNTKADGSGTSYKAGDVIEIDPDGLGGKKVILYAQWERKLANTLWLDTNGGNEGIWTSYTNDTTINIRTRIPTRDEYLFDSWNTEKDGSGTSYQPGDLVEIDPSGKGGVVYKLYAQWAKAYTVTYTDPSGNFENQVYNVKEGDNVPAFEGTPTRDGWAFSTWDAKYKNGEQTKETVTANRTFSARWTKLLAELTEKDAINHGAVRVTDILRPSGSFDLMGANAPHLVEGTFVLNGTTYDAENHKQVASVTITNPEAYAKFLQEVYDQYYDDDCKYIFDEANTPVENLTIHFARRGTYAGSSQYGNLQLKFGAWTLDTDYYPGGTVRSQLLFRRSYSVSVATEMMARANDYSLTLVEVSKGVFELVVEGEPTKEGYKLVGWNTEADGSGTTYQEGDHFNIEPGEGIDLHLYPMWELDLVGTITISPEDLTAYTGGESLNVNSFPNMRYRFTLDGDLDVSDGITLYETEDDVDNEEVLTEVEVNDSVSTLSKALRFFTRAKSSTTTDPTLVPELQPEFTYDLEQSNSEYEGEVNPSDSDQYAGVYNVSVSNGEELIAKIDGKFYDVEVEDANVLIRYVSDPEAILDDGGLDNFTAEVLGSDPSEEVEEITPVIDPDTTYYTNGNESMAVMNKDAVRLLVDELLPPEQSDGVDRRDEMVQKADEYMEGLGKDTADMNYDFKYFDLINTVDGNAWVSSSEGTDIYFPYPEGTDMDTEFTVLHFKDLHREYGLSTNDEITDAINNCEIENMTVENTEYGIKIHVEESGFSPFALSWEEKTTEPDEPSPVDPGKDPSQDDDLAGIKDQLEDLIDKVEGLDKDDYTNDSYKDLMDALDAAKDTLADPNADKEALTNAYDSLMEAYRDLKSNDITIPDTSSNSSYIISGGLILLSASLAIYYKKRLSK